MLTKSEIIDRLGKTSPRELADSPFVALGLITREEFEQGLEAIANGQQTLDPPVDKLVLCDMSREIKSLSANFSGNNKEISNEEAVARARKMFDEIGDRCINQKIRNQDRYPDATFWELNKYTRLGTLESIPIYQIGEEADQPIVEWR